MSTPIDKASLENMRQNYMKASLDETVAGDNPFLLFNRWFHDAVAAKIYEPNAMTLATANADGKPSARVVLMKGITENGLLFYTNFKSRKGSELSANPHCAVVFLWGELERQVRIEGVASPMLKEESEEYFETRPRESKISAAISPQSSVIDSKTALENDWHAFADSHADKQIPMPEHWGGYEIICNCFEFWQGRPGRFHDRIRYRKEGSAWIIERLAP